MKTEVTDLKQLADDLMIFGNKNGAEEIQINIHNSREFTVEVRDGKIERLFEAGSKTLSMKVNALDKIATASTTDLSMETCQKLMQNAIKRALLGSKDPFSRLPNKQFLMSDFPPDLVLYDQAVVDMPPEKKIEIAKQVEALALKDKRINMSLGSSFSTTVGEIIVANTNSFLKSYKYTDCGTGVYLQTGSGDNLFEDGWYENAVLLKNLPSAEEIAKKSIEKAVRLIGAVKIPTQNVPVIMEPMMTARLLAYVAQSVNGNSIYMKQSSMVDKIGQKVASDIVSIIDNGILPDGKGSRPFDSEGVACRKTDVITGGTLQNYLLNSYAANKLKMAPTGNGSGTTNFYMLNGKTKPEQIIKSVEKGLLLTKTIGQGFNVTTGDLSTGAYGLWIEKGEIVHPVTEITISGNLLKMLKDIQMVGNDLALTRSMIGPTIKIAEMSISGK